VTVVIPTRDRWPLLERHALRSALAQEDVDLEVVVVDDGSTDGTTARVTALSDSRVRVVPSTGPGGAAAARNTGIAVARGTWVAFLDDDDLWSPLKLRTQLDDVGTAGWSYTGALVVDAALQPIDTLPLAAPDGLREALRHGNVVGGGGSTVLARTAVLRELGGFDPSLFYVEDWDLWLRLAARCSAAACDDVLVATLDHPQRALFHDRRKVADGIERLLTRSGGTRADRQAAAEWLANEHVRGRRTLTASRLYATAALRFRSPGNAIAATGAVFGRRGVDAAARLLELVGAESHLDRERRPPATPAWLRAFAS
jgi:glycosyltransferase involved in cell wall biosynthesis